MTDRKVFADSVTPLPAQDGLTPHGLMVAAAQPDQATEMMTILFSLAIPAGGEDELQKMVAAGKSLSPADVSKKFAANADDAKTLVAWLKAQGFKIEKISDDKTSIYAQASVAQIQKSLGVNMVRVTKDGITYTAARDAPSLPASVAGSVNAIIGLQPFRRAHKHFRILMHQSGVPTPAKRTKGKPAKGNATLKSTVTGITTNIQNGPPYLVSEILGAYGADSLPVTGKGQTIAILIDTVPTDADLKKFWSINKLPIKISQVKKINVKGVTLPPPEGEETLDVQWSSGVARGANIRIYASGTLNFVDLDRALDAIISDLPSQPGMRQLSISLGLGETFMAVAEVKAQAQKFLRLAASGVNVFVSSGDAGSNPDVTGHNSGNTTQVEYESSDINVIGVGGTTLNLAAGGTVSAETAWISSGGGKSRLFPRPAWQKGAGVPAGNERLVPDVSAAADPNTGALVVLHGKNNQIGGTSWSAPMWAGFCALINEARAKAGKPPLSFLNPLIYPLIGSGAFRDVTSGNNGAFNAGAGYDMITGVGVPNVKKLIAALS